MRICGLDECGRGPLAGPLVAASVILNSKISLLRSKASDGQAILKDSKKLSKKQREKLYSLIIESGARVEIEMITVRQINLRGIGWANKEVFRRLIRKAEADKYIVDGNLKLGKIRGKSHKVKCMIKADATRKCVMAASIVAKVTRDKMMAELHQNFPEYDWNKNAGYGTKKHIQAIKEVGATKFHRRVFVATALKNAR